MTSTSPAIAVEVDPAEVGFDAGRLRRIDAHFDRYVDDGRLPGWLAVVARRGRVAHVASGGARDLEASAPVERDTLWRLYSMTKPITSVAAMMLWESGAFELKDPVARFIPAFADVRVWSQGTNLKAVTQPAVEPVRIWHLLTHTAGLTYGFHQAHPVDAMYRAQRFDWGTPPGMDLAECCDAWAGLPLLFEPGSEWNYSVASDVLGRVVEVASGQSLPEFLDQWILGPLGMADTAFSVGVDDVGRLAALYSPDPATGRARRLDELGQAILSPPAAPAGGGGLVSTAADYQRFVAMVARGGELDGVRLLGSRTVGLMGRNHLPGGVDLEAFGRPLFAETTFDGVGFGLGFAVVQDGVAGRGPASTGELSWGGAASTFFLVDPVEDLTATFFTQLLPSSAHPIRSQLRQLVYQALVD